MPPSKRVSRPSRTGGRKPSPARPKSASRVSRAVRTTARPARPAPRPKPSPKQPFSRPARTPAARQSWPKGTKAPRPARSHSGAPARARVTRAPKPDPARRANREALPTQPVRRGRVRSRPSARPIRVRPGRGRLQRLGVPPRRARPALATAATALAVGAAARAAFGPAYRSRSEGFVRSIALPAPRMAGASSFDEEVAELIDAIGRLQEAALLPAVGDDSDDISSLVSQLPTTLERVRTRGYVHQRQLDTQVNGLVARWNQTYDGLAEALYARQTELVEAANRLLDLVDRLYEPGADHGTVSTCWSGVRALQSQIEAAYRALHSQYDDLAKELEGVEAELVRLLWTLDQVEAAPFTLLAGEAPLRVASARWLRDSDDEGRPGLIFLTDQRIIFVRHEQVVRERFLFITLKRELIQTLEFEAPVRSVTKVQTGQERSGLLGLESTTLIDIRFDETAPLATGHWVLPRDDGSIWVALINRARHRRH